MPNQYSHPTTPIVDVIFPKDLSNIDGPGVAGKAEQVSLRGDLGVGCLSSTEGTLAWLDEYDYFVFQVRTDGTRLAIRKATAEDIKVLRVPLWIQSEMIPICCGREMIFVGQLDDDTTCSEPPEDAAMWWHNAASSFVFTCPVWLEGAAVGQQY